MEERDVTAAVAGKNRALKDFGLAALRNPFVQFVARAIRFDLRPWDRIEMDRICREWVRELGPDRLDVLEISGTSWRSFGFRSYREASYPEFDVCTQVFDDRFDLIVADQVFEHIRYPHRAARNVRMMLRPGGYFLISVPFFVKVHAAPIDCCRWTEDGLRYMLEDCGFDRTSIRTGAWGNAACGRAFMRIWWPRGWGSLRNEAEFPIVVWALARTPGDGSSVTPSE